MDIKKIKLKTLWTAIPLSYLQKKFRKKEATLALTAPCWHLLSSFLFLDYWSTNCLALCA